MVEVQLTALDGQEVGGGTLDALAAAVVAEGPQQVGVVVAQRPDPGVGGPEQCLPGVHRRAGEPDTASVLPRKVHIAKAVEGQLVHRRVRTVQDLRPFEVGVSAA